MKCLVKDDYQAQKCLRNAKCFWNQCKILSVLEQIHRLTTEIPTDLDEALCQFNWQMLFAMWQNGWVQTYGVFVSLPYFTLRKVEGCLDSIVEKAIMKMQEKTQRHTRDLAAQFIDFLQALEYQHINYTLEWYLLRCFYPRIRNFRKKFRKRRERLFQNNFCPDTKIAHYFSKTRQKYFRKITLSNATGFQ